MRKRLISWLMALIMLVGTFPMMAFAESTSAPFTAKADGEAVCVELSDETYTHINWDNTTGATVRLYYLTGLPVDCVQGIATWLFLWFGGDAMLEKLERVKKKYGLTE